MGEEVKLLSMWASSFGHKVELALKLKGVKYEYVEEDLFNKSKLLLELNPVHKQVPVLVHNGKPIAESLVILEYVDEVWNSFPLLPTDPHERANARFWAKFVDDKIVQGGVKLTNSEGEEEKKLVLDEILNSLKLLESELEGKEFFGGERIGYADIAAFFTVYGLLIRQEMMEMNFINEENFSTLLKWIRNLLDIDAVKECVPPRDKHLAYYRTYFASPKSALK